jgi:hypothetical protein
MLYCFIEFVAPINNEFVFVNLPYIFRGNEKIIFIIINDQYAGTNLIRRSHSN